MQKVLVTSRSFGQVSDEPMRILADAGLEVTLLGTRFTQDEFRATAAASDALIIGAHPFPAEDLRRCGSLKIVAKHGAGLDNIPLDLARELGVLVTNVPAMNADAVADLALAHMLNLCRGVSVAAAAVKAGRWQTFLGRDLHHKTLGLVGFGAIARRVARRAALGFSMRVLAYDPYVAEVPAELGDRVQLCELDQVLAAADFVSSHVPLTEATRDLLDATAIARMKPGSYLVNTGRGGVVNEADLYQALLSGHLAGAALDVTTTEPIEADNPLLTLDNVVVTPHIGMYSAEAIGAVSVVCAQNVVDALAGRPVQFRVA